MRRREALNKIMIGAGTTILLPASILSSCSEDVTDDTNGGNNGSNGGNGNLEIDLDDPANSDLNTEGGYKVISGIIIANAGGGNFIALSSVCTHQGCGVVYDDSANNFPCYCHGSVFSTSGSVLQGPASRPLKQYNVERTENILVIS
jgi:cytochrome b6-f complex iron-sulfur subunit